MSGSEWRERAIRSEAEARVQAEEARRWRRTAGEFLDDAVRWRTLADPAGALDMDALPPRWRDLVEGLQSRVMVLVERRES